VGRSLLLGHPEGTRQDAFAGIVPVAAALPLFLAGRHWHSGTLVAVAAVLLFGGLLVTQTRVTVGDHAIVIRRLGIMSRPVVVPSSDIIGVAVVQRPSGRTMVLLRVGRGRAHVLGPFDRGSSCVFRKRHSTLLDVRRPTRRGT